MLGAGRRNRRIGIYEVVNNPDANGTRVVQHVLSLTRWANLKEISASEQEIAKTFSATANCIFTIPRDSETRLVTNLQVVIFNSVIYSIDGVASAEKDNELYIYSTRLVGVTPNIVTEDEETPALDASGFGLPFELSTAIGA